jgi:hypothetical protein
MTHDKPYWKAEIDSLRMELGKVGIGDTEALDKAAHFLAEFGTSPMGDISAMIGIYTCLGFASGQLGDMERLNRFTYKI